MILKIWNKYVPLPFLSVFLQITVTEKVLIKVTENKYFIHLFYDWKQKAFLKLILGFLKKLTTRIISKNCGHAEYRYKADPRESWWTGPLLCMVIWVHHFQACDWSVAGNPVLWLVEKDQSKSSVCAYIAVIHWLNFVLSAVLNRSSKCY